MNRTEHLLFIAAEECAEVAQRLSKVARFGMYEIQPGHMLNNRDRAMQELNDLWAVVEMLGLTDVDRDAIDRKKAKVAAFLEYSEKCGTLDRSDRTGA
jgi:hypothetical protein